MAPRRVFGVHLEAGPDAGERTWVCRAHPGSEGIRVESLDPLAELPGGSSEPVAACASLVSKVLDAPRSAWGFDFAFGLPGKLGPRWLKPADSDREWRRQVAEMAGAEPAAVRQELAAALEKRGARRKTDSPERAGALEGRRLDDAVLGMTRVALPLRGRAGVVLLPLDPLPTAVIGMPEAMRARLPSTYVLEVGPEIVLGELPTELSPPRALAAAGLVRPMARNLRNACETTPGALLAVAAAVAAWRGYRTRDHLRLNSDRHYHFEGYTYC